MFAVRRAVFVPVLLATVSGCAQTGSLFTQQTSLGTLKTSLSQMEFENQQLKREVANLKAQNREIEDRLGQEESINGELSARLDDARSLLGRRGLGGDDLDAGSVQASPRNMFPAGQSNKKRRKPPFARIPGRIDPVAPDVDDDQLGPSSQEDAGPQSRRERPMTWLPVVTGASEPSSSRR
jgi:hypothetical protein